MTSAPSEPWVRQFLIIWLAQLFSIASFTFGLPFVAYYIQEMGVTGEEELLFWTSLFQGLAPIAFCIAAPFWGVMADRYGRKLMLVRSYVGAVIILWGMGWAPSVGWLIVFRIGQGLLTGTMTASQTLIAVSTPEQRHGLALGALTAAVSGGMALGMTLGGYTAEYLGYSEAFYVGGSLSLISALLVGLFVKEKAVGDTASDEPAISKKTALKLAGPLLVVIAVCGLAVHFDDAFRPLLIQQLHGGVEGASAILGNMGALAAIAGIFAGTIWGIASDRFGSIPVGLLCAALSAVLSLPFYFSEELGISPLYPTMFCVAFARAGLDPVFQVWLSRNTLAEHRGVIFGFASTARSIGWAAGPFLGSTLAVATSFTDAYIGRMLAFLFLMPVVLWAGRKATRAKDPPKETSS